MKGFFLVAGTGGFSNQIYQDFKELYQLKSILEEAGIFPISEEYEFNGLLK